MRVYKNPEKIKRDKRKEKRKEEKVKRNIPDPIVYTTPEGEKIKYIPCDVDHEMVVEKKIMVHKLDQGIRKQTFVSPGVYVNETDLSRGRYEREFII